MIDRAGLRNDLIRDEGVKLHCYKDSLGWYTIGVGHLLGNSPRMTEITHAEMMALLEADIDSADKDARELFTPFVFDALSTVRQRVLVNMMFNLGPTKMKKFKGLIGAVQRQDWYAAGTHMADSLWAKQVGQRAVRLRMMMETGEGM